MIKKVIGIILFVVGIGVFISVIYTYLSTSPQELSPIPNNDNVRIIILSPGVTQEAK